jgi:hypothetical protein
MPADVDAFEAPTQSQYDATLVALVNDTSTPAEKPSAEARADLWQRLGYASPEELAAVVGVPASTIRTYVNEGRDAGFAFEPTLRKLTRIAGKVKR